MTSEIIKIIHNKMRTEVDRLLLEYRTTREVFEIRHLEAFDRVLDAETPREAEELAKKALMKIHSTLLAKSGSRLVPGRLSDQTLERQSKNAESLAASLERSGEYEKAEAQRARAEKLKLKARQLKENPEAVIDLPERKKRRPKTRSVKPSRRRTRA